MQETIKPGTLAEELKEYEEWRAILKPMDEWSKRLVRTFAAGVYAAKLGELPPGAAV